jgi:hypothetical protein
MEFIGIILYFIPTIVVMCRQTQNGMKVFAINLLLGWTGIGWVIALIVACKPRSYSGR